MKKFKLAILVLIFSTQVVKAHLYAPAQNSKTHLWGYINADGKKVTKFKYRLAFNFSFGKAVVLLDKWYYLDKENLKEHLFDDTLQRYFSAVVKNLFKSDKLRHYNDSDWVIQNLLVPIYTDEFYLSSGGNSYPIFHFSTPNKLLLENRYLDKKKMEYGYNQYSLYDLNKGFIKEYDQIGNTGRFENNRLLGFNGLKYNNWLDMEKAELGIFDTSAHIIYSLDSIKNSLISKLRTFPDESKKYRRNFDSNITYDLFVYRDLSPECISFEFGIRYSEPDPYIIMDTSFILYFPQNKIYPVKPVSRMNTNEKDDIVDLCKCNGTIFNYLGDYIYKFGKDSVVFNDSTFYFLEKSLGYSGYYRQEFMRKNKQALPLYVYAEQQNNAVFYSERIYLWGVWDGKKIIVKPKYQLMGVFN